MNQSFNSKFLDDPEFQSLLVACFESLQRGDVIDLKALERDFPEFAGEINQFLQDRQLLEQVAAELEHVEPSALAINAYEKTIGTAHSSDFELNEKIHYIGEYEILEEVARGGMGIVFKAKQQSLNRIVALKMILAGRLADASDVERFHREARAAGKLKHPAIVSVYEIGEYEGRHYFTMDYVDGRSLSEIIRDETLAPRVAATIVKSIANAVQFAHERGTVHRDLKPANVLIDSENQPHVTDFGLAKILDSVDEDSRAELTATGQILGTPSYMSPEQASGKQELVGPASDIYSIGAILYAGLSGRAPFVADSPVDTLLQVMKKEPVSPRELNPVVPKDLETICLKCLEKEPHKRYGTAQLLAEDLQRFLEDRPILARPADFSEKTIRWCRRNPAVAGLLMLVLLTMATGTIVSTYYASEANRRASLALSAKQTAEYARESEERNRKHAETMTEFAMTQQSHAQLARDLAEKERDRANQQMQIAESALTRSLFEQANAVRLAGSEGHRWNALDILKQAETLRSKYDDASDADSPEGLLEKWELRSAAVATLLIQDSRLVNSWSSMYQAVDPLGEFVGLLEIASAQSPSVKMRVVKIASGQTVGTLDLSLSAKEFAGHTFAISPGGKMLASVLLSGIQLKDIETGKTIANLPWLKEDQSEEVNSSYGAQSHLQFSPQGDRLIAFRSVDGKGQTMIWNIPANFADDMKNDSVHSSHKISGRFLGTTRASIFASPCFSRDGQRVAYFDSMQKVVVENLSEDEEEFIIEIPKPMYPFGPLSFADDGQSIALVTVSDTPRQSAIVVWDLNENKQRHKIMTSQSIWLTPPRLSPDGRYIAAGTPQGKIAVFSLDDHKPKLTMDHGGAARFVGWLSENSLWSTAAGGFKQWELSLEQPVREVSTTSPGDFASLRFMFSRDGTRMVATTSRSEMYVYSWPEAERIRTIKVPVRTALNINPGRNGTQAVVTGIRDPTGTSAKLADYGILQTTTVGYDLSTGEELFRKDGRGALATGITDEGGVRLLSKDKNVLRVTEDETESEIWSKTFALPPGIEPVARICADGSRVAIWNTSLMISIEHSNLEVWDLEENKQAFLIENRDDPITDVQFSSDGKKLLSLHNDQILNGLGQSSREANGTAVVRNSLTGEVELTIKGAKITAAALNHDGTLLAVQFWSQHVEIWNVNTGEHLFDWMLPDAERTFVDNFDIKFTSDGQHLGAVVNSNGLLQFLDLKEVHVLLKLIDLD